MINGWPYARSNRNMVRIKDTCTLEEFILKDSIYKDLSHRLYILMAESTPTSTGVGIHLLKERLHKQKAKLFGDHECGWVDQPNGIERAVARMIQHEISSTKVSIDRKS